MMNVAAAENLTKRKRIRRRAKSRCPRTMASFVPVPVRALWACTTDAYSPLGQVRVPLGGNDIKMARLISHSRLTPSAQRGGRFDWRGRGRILRTSFSPPIA